MFFKVYWFLGRALSFLSCDVCKRGPPLFKIIFPLGFHCSHNFRTVLYNFFSSLSAFAQLLVQWQHRFFVVVVLVELQHAHSAGVLQCISKRVNTIPEWKTTSRVNNIHKHKRMILRSPLVLFALGCLFLSVYIHRGLAHALELTTSLTFCRLSYCSCKP